MLPSWQKSPLGVTDWVSFSPMGWLLHGWERRECGVREEEERKMRGRGGMKQWRRLCFICAHVEGKGRMLGASRPASVYKCCCQRTLSAVQPGLISRHATASSFCLVCGRIKINIVQQSVVIVDLHSL